MKNQSRSCPAMILLVFTLFFCVNTASAQKVLKYSDHEPDSGMRTKFLKDVFFPAIEKESKGRLKIEPHWNGELASSYDAMKTVSAGVAADITTVVPEYFAKELPLNQLFKSFLVGPTGQKQVSLFRNAYAEIPEFANEIAKNNIKDIFLSTGYGVGFFSRDPINSLAALKGARWRTASFWHRDILKNYETTPVTLPWGPAVYEALKDKSLDGLMVNIDGGYNLKVYEPAPYLLASDKLWLGHLYVVAINQKTWNDLPKEDQLAIERAAETAYQSLGQVMDSSFNEQMQNLKTVGAQYRILNNQELKEFETATKFQEVQQRWATEQESNGVAKATAILGKLSTMINNSMK